MTNCLGEQIGPVAMAVAHRDELSLCGLAHDAARLRQRCTDAAAARRPFAAGTMVACREDVITFLLDSSWELIQTRQTPDRDAWEAVLERDGFVLRIDTRYASANICVSFRFGDAARTEAYDILDSTMELFEFSEPTDDEVDTAFMWVDPHGNPVSFTKRIKCPTWDSVKKNYPDHADLEALFRLEDPSAHGRIILWQGSPGTGKTWLVRALMRHWQMRTSVILEPERYFASTGALQAILSHADTGQPKPVDVSRPAREGVLVVVEDAADLILAKSREHYGWHISRLLNLTDGLFGDGVKPIFLITINEDVDGVDPAIMRPGRCLQSRIFRDFRHDDAMSWLHAQTGDASWLSRPATKDSWTLAELYECLRGDDSASLRQSPMRAVAGF